MGVYAGKFLRVDLSRRTWHVESISEEEVRKWLLGSGFAAWKYYQEMDVAVAPLDPASPLLVFNGLLSGTFAPTGCRTSCCGRSPLTGIWNEATVGHHWGAELRACGYDGLMITGRASQPAYLYVNSLTNTIELRDATHLWGKDYFETADALLAETDRRAQVAGIGPAGENLVKIAGIMVGPSHYVRAAARGGMGAVLGSKRLKAIVVRGTQRPDYPDPAAFRDIVREHNAFIKENSIALANFGTAGGLVGAEKQGDLPIRNWILGSWPDAEKVSGQTLYSKYLVRHTFCHACPIGCGKEIEVREGKYVVPRGEGVEYETLAGFSALVMNPEVEAVALANSLCNRYGLDTISTSSAIAFAMEAYEREIIGPCDTGGLVLRFGDPDVVLALIEKIAYRRDIGDLLAEGVRAAAERLGDEAKEFAVHVKGMEVPYHDPRAFVHMAVNYATATRGACHLESLSYWNGYNITLPDLGYPDKVPPHESGELQARMAYDYQNYVSVYNPLGLCKFIIKARVGPERLCQIVNGALGWSWTPQDVLTTGERLFQLKRLINVRLGVTAADDTLPPRLLRQARPEGGAAGVLPDLTAMLRTYYALRDWDEQGVPRRRRLEQLGIV
ncbi:MAG: aldehyde ferredoxin oxidoreductase family protein [Anaerolineae bacterium]|nr:aldehyde ferredoxin oxidoreductase family protein [Anaerolineae bacterium]